MAGDSYQELPRAKRRRLIIRAVLHSLLFATVLVDLYCLLPLDRPLGADTAVRLLAGLLVFAGVMVVGHNNHSLALPGCASSRGAGFDRSPLPAAVRLDVLPDGTGSDVFDQAITQFATAYADQNERDQQTLVDAVAAGRITAERDM